MPPVSSGEAAPLGILSAESQPAPDTTPTAAVQKKQVEQQGADNAAASNQKALQAAVQTQLASVNVQRVPVDRIDEMVTDGLAFRSSNDSRYVYFASVDGDKVVRFILEKYNVTEMRSAAKGEMYPEKVGEAYKVVWKQVMPTGTDGALPAEQVLANVNTRQKADAEIDMIIARRAEGVRDAIVGTFDFTVNFVGHATPIVGTAMTFAQDGAKEGFISLAGDVAFFATFGASKLATTSVAGARTLRITAGGAQGLIGAARSSQAYFAVQDGEYVKAGGYMGEALLRFIGVRKAIVDELKGIQAARAARLAQAANTVANSRVVSINTVNGTADVLVGGGATTSRLSPQNAAKIQEFVDKYRVDVTVVGGRVNPGKPLTPGVSDWDYVINPISGVQPSKSLREIKQSATKFLPKGSPRTDHLGNTRQGIDVERNVSVNERLPYVTFRPR